MLLTKLRDLETAARELRAKATSIPELSEPAQKRHIENLKRLQKSEVPKLSSYSTERPKDCIQDLEEFTLYVRFLSEVLSRLNAKGKEPV